MDAALWQRLSPELDRLLELDPEARALRLAALRAADPALADELDALLALDADAGGFLEESIVAGLAGACHGARIGPYALDRLLGEGGMGQVWLAHRADGLYERRVALKLLRPGLADPGLRLRFTRERQILARLEHPHIAHLLDAGIDASQQPYLALDYVDGAPITDWCHRRHLLVPRRIRLFLQVCAAVSHAHASLIVHLDLKPSNILVTDDGNVRLLDFGIAKLLDTQDHGPEQTRSGMRAFTLHYAAPEQVRGEPVTTMTDIYALGVVLHELLSGRKPYRPTRETAASWEQAILDSDPLRPSIALLREGGELAPSQRRRMARAIAGDLDNIVLRALAKQPEDRYASVEALAQDLRRWLDDKPVQARPQRIGYRLRKYVSRHRWALASTAAVVGTLAGALGAVSWQAGEAIEESARAQAMQDFVTGLFEYTGSSPRGAPLDVRDLLDAGVQRGDAELARQPRARAELYGVIARLRLGLGDYEQALALLQRQEALLEPLADVPASLRLQSASDHARALRMLGRGPDCIAHAGPHRALARQREATVPRQAADLYTQLGRCHRDRGDFDTARELFDAALTLRRQGRGDDAGIVESLADLASLHSASGDVPRALVTVDSALARLEDRLGMRHPLAIDLLRARCALRRTQGETRDAEASCTSSVGLALDLYGPGHPATLDARRQLAALHVDQGRFVEAEAEFRDALVQTVARLGPRHPDVARIHNSLGIIAWERGDEAVALAELARCVEIWRASTPGSLLADGLFNQAMVLQAFGHSRQARPLVLESLALRRERFGDRHGLVGDALRLLGEIEAAEGDWQDARTHLAEAVAITRSGYGEDHPATQRATLARARVEARLGDAAALARLDALASSPATDVESRKLAWLARAHAASVRCAGGARVVARAEFAALDAQLRDARPQGGALVREIDAARGACAPTLARR
ncbi:serine/threonine-protein kinase [Luteimonas deserti]|uniref:Tetratricopeptide repeat protein n=1 Tax=Luteimonas deserti TaxID=2752306 RepID=A0A7Z0QRJ1_9GAMM|nr:serine/threonine-protein kinase [Luteimonas deserti]NYZ63388.1 tetratricopeptide repeat protein [Luteimonas deserti]